MDNVQSERILIIAKYHRFQISIPFWVNSPSQSTRNQILSRNFRVNADLKLKKKAALIIQTKVYKYNQSAPEFLYYEWFSRLARNIPICKHEFKLLRFWKYKISYEHESHNRQFNEKEDTL